MSRSQRSGSRRVSRGLGRLHAIAAAMHRGTARLSRRSDPDPRRVTILLMHAWGMGGTIRTVLTMAGQLAADHDVEIVSIVRRRDDPFFAFPPGVTVTAIDDQRGRSGRGPARWVRALLRRCPSLLMHPADRASDACSLWTDVLLVRRLRRVRSGALIGTRPALNLLIAGAARRGVPTIGEEHLHFDIYGPHLRAAICRRYPALTCLVTLTERDAERYREVLDPAPRVLALPNAVPRRPEPPAPLEHPVIIGAGRLTAQKSFERLIDAFARVAPAHPRWTLEICGSGPRQRALERRVAQHGLDGQVRLPGRVQDLPQRLQDASIFALSSRREGFPMVLLEAMSHGVPAVSFDCPTGPREVVDSGVNGLLVADGDIDAFAAALQRLMDDADLRRRCGAGARATAAAYDVEAISARWSLLLGELQPVPRGRRSHLRLMRSA